MCGDTGHAYQLDSQCPYKVLADHEERSEIARRGWITRRRNMRLDQEGF